MLMVASKCKDGFVKSLNKILFMSRIQYQDVQN